MIKTLNCDFLIINEWFDITNELNVIYAIVYARYTFYVFGQRTFYPKLIFNLTSLL